MSCTRQIRWRGSATSPAATPQPDREPVNVTVGGFEQPLAKSYNVNVAFQRDIGFNTVVEIAYVGNFTVESRALRRRQPAAALRVRRRQQPGEQRRHQRELAASYGNYPGMGSQRLLPALYNNAAVQRPAVAAGASPDQRPATGFAYTLAKGEGYTGYDPYTDQIGGEAAFLARYWGPTSVDRRHNISATWSYDVPTLTEIPVLKQLIMDWQFSGIFRMLSGQAMTPTCSSNNPGINNSNPSLTDGRCTRCELVGEPFQRLQSDPNCREADRRTSTWPRSHAAAQRQHRQLWQQPVGILRHPTWHEWDLTLSRRFRST